MASARSKFSAYVWRVCASLCVESRVYVYTRRAGRDHVPVRALVVMVETQRPTPSEREKKQPDGKARPSDYYSSFAL